VGQALVPTTQDQSWINSFVPPKDPGILPTFYAHLLCAKIPKVAKDSVYVSVFFALLGSARIKAARKMLVKSTPEHDFVNCVILERIL
jgi:hypothetical protein